MFNATVGKTEAWKAKVLTHKTTQSRKLTITFTTI